MHFGRFQTLLRYGIQIFTVNNSSLPALGILTNFTKNILHYLAGHLATAEIVEIIFWLNQISD